MAHEDRDGITRCSSSPPPAANRAGYSAPTGAAVIPGRHLASEQAQISPLQLAMQPPRPDAGPQELELVQAMHCAARGVATPADARSAAQAAIHITTPFMHHLVE